MNQFVTSSGHPLTMQLDSAIAIAGLSRQQAENIFHLTCITQKLGRKLAHDFINLSSQEALFRMGIQATGYEKVASGCPDCVSAYYTMMCSEGVEAGKLNEAFDCLCKEAGEAWLDTNSILFCHTLEYQNKLSNFLKESKGAIEALHGCIWTVMVQVMEVTGKPAADGLGITMCLVDMLPTIPTHLAFHSSTPGLTSFVPEVYAAQPWFRTDILDLTHMPPPQGDQKVLDVLCEEIIKNMGGASKTAKAVEPASLSTIGGKTCKLAPVIALPIAHVHHDLWAGRVRPGLGLHGVIHKVHDLVHLPLALVPGQGMCQAPVQDHHNQIPTLDLMPDPKCLQKVAVLMGQDILIPHHLR